MVQLVGDAGNTGCPPLTLQHTQCVAGLLYKEGNTTRVSAGYGEVGATGPPQAAALAKNPTSSRYDGGAQVQFYKSHTTPQTPSHDHSWLQSGVQNTEHTPLPTR